MNAHEQQVALPLRSHTILGVCEGLGEDLGFNPLILRVPLAASVIFSPVGAIATYLALGVVVMLSRLIAPKRTAVTAPEIVAEEPQVELADEQPLEFAKAA